MITLTFDVNNNFCPVCSKHGTSGDRIEIAKTAAWVINNAMCSIEESYSEDAPRLIQMRQLYENLKEQLRKQLTQEECEQIKI